MDQKIIEELGFEGLKWVGNIFINTGKESYTLVANEGPAVTDMLFYATDTYNGNFEMQLGQLNRYTFYGNPNQEISAEFIDCRVGSKTLHQKTVIKFQPDATRCLHIPPGVAKSFSGLRDITIRSEPIWFAPSMKNEYNAGNDIIIFSGNEKKPPIVEPNDLPLPKEVLQIMLNREQEVLKSGRTTYGTIDAQVNGKLHRITLLPKS